MPPHVSRTFAGKNSHRLAPTNVLSTFVATSLTVTGLGTDGGYVLLSHPLGPMLMERLLLAACEAGRTVGASAPRRVAGAAHLDGATAVCRPAAARLSHP